MRALMMDVTRKATGRATKTTFRSGRWLAICFLMGWGAGCAGTGAGRPGAAAGGVTADDGGPLTETMAEEPKDEAEIRFAALGKELEAMVGDKPVNSEWLESELKAVLKLKASHTAARYNLAMLRAKLANKPMSQDVYEDLLSGDPEFGPARENLAADYVDAGKKDEAEEIYEELIGRDPKALTSRLALARIYVRQKKYQAAIELCRKVLQRQADAIEAFRILAESYQAIGDTSMAELIIGRGLKVDENDVELHYLTARILLARDDLTAAVAKLKHVIRLRPDWLKVRGQLAEIALAHSDFSNAAQQFEAILKNAPNDRGAKIGLAISYKGLGRHDQAEKLYRELLTKNSKDSDVLWNLAMLYWRHLKKYDKAISLLKRFDQAATPGDKYLAKVDLSIKQINREKKDVAAQKAREERERKRREAIAAACQAIRNGQKADAEAIGGEQERIQAAWDLLLVTAVTKIQQDGDVRGGKAAADCALGILPNTPGAGMAACAQLRVNWVQIQDQVGLLTTSADFRRARATIKEALKCDPENPDAQLFAQQLDELIQKAEAAESVGAPPGGGVPMP